MKSGLKQLIEWWERDVKEGLHWQYSDTWAGRTIFSKARSLLAEEEAATPDKGKDELREKIQDIIEDTVWAGGEFDDVKCALVSALSRYPKPVSEESLEELAKRKNCEIHGMVDVIRMDNGQNAGTWPAINLQDAIHQARTYLNTLPDHDGKEK